MDWLILTIVRLIQWKDFYFFLVVLWPVSKITPLSTSPWQCHCPWQWSNFWKQLQDNRKKSKSLFTEYNNGWNAGYIYTVSYNIVYVIVNFLSIYAWQWFFEQKCEEILLDLCATSQDGGDGNKFGPWFSIIRCIEISTGDIDLTNSNHFFIWFVVCVVKQNRSFDRCFVWPAIHVVAVVHWRYCVKKINKNYSNSKK